MDLIVPNFIKYQLYLLQLENYDLDRYAALLKARGYFPSRARALRKELVWTKKANALMLMAAALHLIFIVVAGLATLALSPGLDNLLVAVLITFIVILPFYFVLFSAAVLLIKPLDVTVKNKLVDQARAKLSSMQNLKVIGVAGSYGKTTMKEVLHQVLGIRYKVLAPAESVNTPVGIARFILNNLTADTKILILELGEHYQGDIKQLCEIAAPDVVVLTGINEAHLERMGTLATIAATIFEAVEFAKEDALVVLNGDDNRISSNYQQYTKDREVRFYGNGRGRTDYWVTEQKFSATELAWSFNLKNHGTFTLPLLGEYAIGTAVAAVAVGEHFGMNSTDIKVGLSQVRPVEHRLQPILSPSNVLVIDDSYNGNPNGAAEAIKVLSRFIDRRKIYITPGLVEMGSGSAEVHRQIGRDLAKAADVVILIKNSVTQYIEEGILEAGEKKTEGQNIKIKVLEKPQIVWFDSAPKMHEALKKIIEPGDVVLFQNDWGDQYL